MGYLLETLGRGLLGQLADAFATHLPRDTAADLPELQARAALSPTSFDAHVRLGTAALHAGARPAAQAAFELAAGLEPERALPLIGMACVHDGAGRIDDAITCLELAGERDPGDSAIAFGIALCHERAGRTTEAHIGYRAALRLCPQLRNAHERLAALAVVRRDWAAAAEAYTTLAALEPDDLDVLVTLGALRWNAGRYDDALEHFQRALLIEPEANDDVLRADELDNDGALDEAIETLARVVAQYPGVTEFRVQLGDLFVKAGEDLRAVEQYRAALELHPNFLEATVKLGTQHLREQRFELAAEQFSRAVELNDRLLLAFVGLGLAQAACRHAADSEATLDLAVGLAPNSTLLFSEATRLHLKADGRSAAAGRQATAIATECADPFFTLAVDRCRTLARTRPDDAAAQYRLGLLMRQSGEYEAALGAFRRAVAIDPAYTKALLKLGVGLRELGDQEAAAAAFRAAFTPDAGSIEHHYRLALLFAQRPRFDWTLDHFAPDGATHAEVRARLTLALEHAGLLNRADAAIEALREMRTRSQAADDPVLTRRNELLRD